MLGIIRKRIAKKMLGIIIPHSFCVQFCSSRRWYLFCEMEKVQIDQEIRAPFLGERAKGFVASFFQRIIDYP